MRNKILIIIGIASLAASIAFHLAIKKKPVEREVNDISRSILNASLWQGKYPPDFELELLNKEKFILSEQIGKKVIILNFFATWCKPCNEEMPELMSYYHKHKAEGLILLGINVNEKKDLVEKFVTEKNLDFPIGIDNESHIQKEYGVENYPTTIFIGADGKIALYETGAIYNAEVTFESLYKISHDILRKNSGIDRATYLANMAKQPPLRKKDYEEDKQEKIVLEGKAAEFAARMRCPSCSKSLMDCRCDLCSAIKKKLKQMNLENKTNGDILRELFDEEILKKCFIEGSNEDD